MPTTVNFPAFGARKVFEHVSREWSKVFESICPGTKQDNDHFQFRQVLLRCEFLVDCDERVEFLFSECQQIAVLDARPAAFRDRCD